MDGERGGDRASSASGDDELDTPPIIGVRGVLERVIARNSLTEPDCRPLYAYRVTEAELRDLRRVIEEALRWTADPGREASAALCLYLAEKFRQNHASGPWEWNTALDGLATGREGYPWLYEVIGRGFDFWRRPIHDSGERTQWLVSIACEGGLPLGLLKREGTHLHRYFSRVLRDVEQYSGMRARDAAEYWREEVPETLRYETAYQLAGDLVEAVAAARRLVAGAPDPIATLEQKDSAWRSRFPLRIEEGLARRLFEGLMREPRGVSVSAEPRVLVQTILRGRETFRLDRQGVLASEVSARILGEQLGVAVSELEGRFRLALVAGQASPIPFARATKRTGSDTYRIDILGGRMSDVMSQEDLAGGVELSKLCRGRSTPRVAVPGGDALPADLPWVFADTPEGDDRVLLAVGGHAARAPSLVVVLPADWSVESGRNETLCESGPVGRRVVRITESAVLSSGSDSVDLRVGQEADEEGPVFVLQGERRSFDRLAAFVWSGAPDVCRVTERGPIPISVDQVEWRTANGKSWSPYSAHCIGDGWVRVVDEGRTLFKARAPILPEGASLQSRIGDREGDLILRGVDARIVRPQPLEGVEFEQLRHAGETVVRCRAARDDVEIGGRITLQAVLAAGARIDLEAPVPFRQVAFVGRDGTVYPDNHRVCLDDLIGARARALGAGVRDKWFVQACGRSGKVVVGELDGDCQELVLDTALTTIRQFFAEDADLDRVVELELVKLGVGCRPRRLRVSRFETRLEPDTSGQFVVIDEASRDRRRPEDLDVSLIPISCPSQEIGPLPAGLFPHSWELDVAAHGAGPWLVVGRKGERLLSRPRLIQDPGGSIPPLELALAAGFREIVRLRPGMIDEALDRYLDELGNDFGHRGWDELGEYIDSLGDLPAMTFRVIESLSRKPHVAALAAIRYVDLPDRWGRMWYGLEELPFSWATTPIVAWFSAARALKRWAESLPSIAGLDIGDGDRFAGFLERLRERAESRLPSVKPLVELVLFSLADAPAGEALACASTPQGMRDLVEQFYGLCNGLRVRHSGVDAADWPRLDRSPRELVRECGVEVPEAEWIEPTDARYDHVVNAPVAAAHLVVGSGRCVPAVSARLMLSRSFDEEWFDFAHQNLVTRLIADRLRCDPGAFDV